MTEFTPKPWRINEKAKNQASVSIRGADNFAVCACRMMAPDGTRWHAQTAEANARLIVRAVNCHAELLEALEAAVARVEVANNEGNPIMSAWLPQARAAIAKARGG